MLKRRRIKWLGFSALAIAVIGPPLAFGISNLLLMSPKGRSFVAARIQRSIRLENSVQGCTWSPWNGFTVYGLLVQQPDRLSKATPTPILAAESIRIHPDWQALLDKRIRIRGIEIRKPELTVAIEMFSQLPGTTAMEPTVAAEPPDLVAQAQQPDGITPAAPSAVPAPPQNQIPQPEAALAAKPEIPPSRAAVVVMEPTVWMTFTDAKVSVVSAMSKEPLYRISRINGGLPIGGKNSRSELFLDGISVLGNPIQDAIRIPIEWQSPVLGVGAFDTRILGIGCRLEAKIGLTPGFPFLIGGVLPKQDGREIVLSETTRAKLGSIVGQSHCEGFLLIPGSWQGKSMFQALSINAEYLGHKTFFSHGQGLVMLQRGVLRCLDARLVGDDVSLLGNGMALFDGRFAANLRIVAAPESLAVISMHTQTDSSPPQLTPLSTPQRAALDMRTFGFPGRVFYQANPAAKPVLLR